MSIELEPSELGFKRPFTHEVSQLLRLHNPNSDPLAFKVKTTAPKQYCVRPNSGRIEAGRDVEVQVLLQAMKDDPPPDARCRDKFLVQSVVITADKEHSNVSQIWQNIEATAKSSIQEKKIRVTFLPADGSAAPANGEQHDDEHPPAYSSPSPSAAAVTPQRSSAAPVGSVFKFDSKPSKPEGAKDLGTIRSEAHNPATQSTLSNAAAAVSSAIPTSQAHLQRQLEEAKGTISRLQTQASEGLRQRKTGASGDDEKSSMSQVMQNAPAPGGVPIQIVAGLCLLCFLIAYLFF